MKQPLTDTRADISIASSNGALEMPLTAALNYIADKLGLPEGETIQIDCYLDEARELQTIVNRWDGAIQWNRPPGADTELPIEDYRFECLLGLVKEHNLCIQFIDTYPCVAEGNIRVLISTRKTTQERLERCEGTLGMVLVRKGSSQLHKIAQDALKSAGSHPAPPHAGRAIANPLQGSNPASSKARSQKKGGKK